MKSNLKEYNGYELFPDPNYYDLIACRKLGEKSFQLTKHFVSFDKAKEYIDNLEKPMEG